MDLDPSRVGALCEGRPYLHEPGIQAALTANRDRVRFTTDAVEPYRRAGIVFVAVPTPPLPGGRAKLEHVDAAVAACPDGWEGTLVMKSTVPVGTGARIRTRLGARGRDYASYVSNPEFLREGHALIDFLQPDRIVVGSFEREPAEQVASLYHRIPARVIFTDVATAELAKYASNAFLATKISFINEIANVCDLCNADVRDIAAIMGQDPRIGELFLSPGVGYGGSCFPKDTRALQQLAGESGYHFKLLEATIEVNREQRLRVVQKLEHHLGPLRGRRIALLGLAFKPDTDDVRDSPTIDIAVPLIAAGADVVGHDPLVCSLAEVPALQVVREPERLLDGADAVVLVADWPQYRSLPWAGLRDQMRTPLIVDGRNALDGRWLGTLGYTYLGFGVPAEAGRVRDPAVAVSG
jgi:UDPglucose 6-dehydrogenase